MPENVLPDKQNARILIRLGEKVIRLLPLNGFS